MQENNKLPLTKKNYMLMLIGLGVIVLGFILMTGGASSSPEKFNAAEMFSFRRITLAPIVVMLGFAFEIFAIMYKPKNKEQ